MRQPAILVADHEEGPRRDLTGWCRSQGFAVIESSDDADALRALQAAQPDLVIVGSPLGGAWAGLELARQIRRRDGRVPLILITADSSEELAIAALKAGVSDYFKRPFPPEELVASVHRCLLDLPPRGPRANDDPSLSDLSDGHIMIGESPLMQEIKAYIRRVASTDSNVLITGETGTGKELVAELIHANSSRHHQPFVCINCAALPDTLLESELFGYERGAFTGAYAVKEGNLRLADGGTVFFDEIGDMTPFAQAKILRAIETRRVYRLGGKTGLPLDIRLIAATNRDLECLVAEGRFRNDLYFRLDVARVELPPLRNRKEDIPALVDHYIREFNHRFGREVEAFTAEALEHLFRYDWPGNVRELRNLLEATFVSLPPPRISFLDLPKPFRRRLREIASAPGAERDRLLSALFSTNWNKSKAAQKLHWSRMTLYRKMAKHHVTRASEARADRRTGRASLPHPVTAE